MSENSKATGLTTSGFRSAGEAIAAYGERALRAADAERCIGLESVLEVIARFCDEVAPEILDPLARRRVERGARGDDLSPRDHIAAERLPRLMAACGRLFPYQIVCSSGVITCFRSELPRLVRWLAERGVASREDLAAFERAWSCARANLARHIRLQESIERWSKPFQFIADPDVRVGHYLIERVTPAGLWLRCEELRLGPVRLPGDAAALFTAGEEVTIAMHRSAMGWRPLAASLPCRPHEIDAIMDEARTSS